MSRPDPDLLRETLEHLPAGLMLFRSVRDAGGTIIDFEWLFTSELAAKLMGHSDAELRGKRLLEELPRQREGGLFETYVRVVETGEPSEGEFHHSHGPIDGWFTKRVTKVGDGFSIMFADASKRRRPTPGHRARGELVERLFMQAPFAIAVVHGPEHTFLLANPEYEQLVGCSNLVGRTFREVFPELSAAPPIVRMLDEVRASGTPSSTTESEVPIRRGETVEYRYFQFSC